MNYVKLQLGCFVIVLYIIIIYVRECKKQGLLQERRPFHFLLASGLVSVIFDGATAYTVNHIAQVGELCNRILHLVFLLSLDTFIFMVFVYMLHITKGIPQSRKGQALIGLPYVVNVILVVVNIKDLEYRTGVITNYSMGWSAYTCFAMALIYIALSLINFLRRWVYIEMDKKWTSKFGKLSSGHRTGKAQFSFQSQRKAVSKNAQTITQLYSSHTLVK